jgi:formylglycine-generating enzyme required for sulfatase activity
MNLPQRNEEVYTPNNMVYVPPGVFLVGGTFKNSEKPIHPVYLSGYFIDRYEVTNEQYTVFLNEKCKHTHDGNIWMDIESKFCLIKLDYHAKKI